MPRQRDHHAEYLRRQELAAERFPNASQAERTAHARGRRSPAALVQTIRSGSVTNVDVQPTQGPDGRYQHIDVVVEMRDGSHRTFRLQGRKATQAELDKLARRLAKPRKGLPGIRVQGIEYLRKSRKARVA